MTGVCSPSMPVWVVEDGGRRAYSTLNEGPGRTLWFGVGDDEAVERLRFFRDELGPSLARLLEHRGPVDVFGLAAQGLNMGDELHMRSQATGNLLIRDLAPAFAALGGEASARFIAGNHHFFLNLTMAAAKCASLAAAGVEGVERRVADVAQRHRRRDPGRRAARAAGSRRRPRRSRTRCCARATAPTTRRSTSATRR